MELSKLSPGILCLSGCDKVLVAELRPTLCDPVDCLTPGFPVPPHLLELARARLKIDPNLNLPVLLSLGCRKQRTMVSVA